MRILEKDHRGAVVQDRLEPGLALDQSLFQSLAVCDLPHYGHGALYAAAGTPDGRERERYVNLTPVFAHSHGVKCLDRFAVLDAVKSLFQLIAPVRRNEERDGTSNHLSGGVAKHPLRSLVPTEDNPV